MCDTICQFEETSDKYINDHASTRNLPIQLQVKYKINEKKIKNKIASKKNKY